MAVCCASARLTVVSFVAILLGQLQMDVADSIATYSKLMDAVNQQDIHQHHGEARSSSTKLEVAISEIIEAGGKPATHAFTVATDHGCRVLVRFFKTVTRSTANESLSVGFYASSGEIHSQRGVFRTTAPLLSQPVNQRFARRWWRHSQEPASIGPQARVAAMRVAPWARWRWPPKRQQQRRRFGARRRRL